MPHSGRDVNKPNTAPQPLRIIFAVDGFCLGGAERMLLDLVRRLDPHRYRRVVFSTGAEGPLMPAFETAADRIVSLPKQRKFDIRLVPELARLIREEDAHLVVSVLFYADVISGLASRLSPVPIVSWQHVLPSHDIKNRRFYHRAAFRLAHPRFRRIVCCSECLRQDIAGKYRIPLSRLITIHNGVDLERFAYGPPPADTGAFTIGIVGGFRPEKGQVHMIRALPRIREKIRNVRVVFVGDGPTLPSLTALATETGVGESIVFHGPSTEVERLYPHFHLVVLSSEYETHPVTALEAMACGRAVVASDVGGTPEAVVPGETGLLFPGGDAEALAACVLQLAGDPDRLAAMGRAGRKRAETAFDLVQQQGKLIDVLHETAGVPRP